MRLSLDGTPKEVQRNYIKFLKKVRRWYYSKGHKENASPIFGRKKMVYTTPVQGTLYVDVTHDSDFVTFVIQAKHGWLRGYTIDDVGYELKPDLGEENYMPHPKHQKLSFKGNHHSISGGNPGALIIGQDKLRKALKSILESKGNPDPEDIGIFVLYLCEGPKLPLVGNILCKSIVCSAVSRLENYAPWINDMIRSWSEFSKEIMTYLDHVARGLKLPPLKNKHEVPGMDSIQKYVANVRILHLHSYNSGIFHYTEMKDADIWEEREVYEGKAIRIPGTYAKKNILNDSEGMNRDKGAGDTTIPKCRAAPSTKQIKRSGHSRWILSQKTEVIQSNYAHKRQMSTAPSNHKLIYGECHMKSLKGIELMHNTKVCENY